MRRSDSRTVWYVGVAALVIAIAISAQNLSRFSGDPSGFARFSVGASRLAEPLIGDVIVEAGSGHDGKFFFALANDPWLSDPQALAPWLDDPLYRAQRMLYPAIAGGFGLASPEVIIWSLLVVNVVALAAGSAAAALVATHHGVSPWSGLAFVLNPGMLFEMLIDGSSIVGMAWAFAALALLASNRRIWAAVAFALAVLSRETMLLLVFGAFVFDVVKRRLPDWWLLVVPLLAYGSWTAWARARLGAIEPRLSVSDLNLDPPFRGLAEAVPTWLGAGGLTVAVAVLVLAACAVVMLGLWRRASLVSYAAAPFVPLLFILSVPVLAEPFDLTRSIAPVITASSIALLADASRVGARDEVFARGADS